MLEVIVEKEDQYMELLDVMKKRHSIRNYSNEKVSDECINQILQAGMLSASGRNRKPWEFIVVKDHTLLEQMTACRVAGAQMLAGADAAIVVIGDVEKSDTWVEDCSIAMANMHLMAHSLNVGSCWIQGRNRDAKDGCSTEEFLRSMLHFPKNYQLLAMLSLGMPNETKVPVELDTLPYDKIHWNRY